MKPSGLLLLLGIAARAAMAMPAAAPAPVSVDDPATFEGLDPAASAAIAAAVATGDDDSKTKTKRSAFDPDLLTVRDLEIPRDSDRGRPGHRRYGYRKHGHRKFGPLARGGRRSRKHVTGGPDVSSAALTGLKGRAPVFSEEDPAGTVEVPDSSAVVDTPVRAGRIPRDA